MWCIGYSMSDFYIGSMGLINSFHMLYIISYSILILGFTILGYGSISSKSKYFYLISMGLIITILFSGTPYFFEGTPSNSHSFSLYRHVDSIQKSGMLNPSYDLWYHSWPGMFIIISSIQHICSLQAETILSYIPIATAGLLNIFIVYTLNYYLEYDSDKIIKLYVGSTLFTMYNFLNLDYLTPSNLAFLLYLVFLGYLAKWIIRGKRSFQDSIVILLLAAIIISHVMTPITVLLIVSAFYCLCNATDRLNISFPFRELFHGKRFSLLPIIVLLGVLFIAWLIFGASQQLENRLPQLISELRRFDASIRVVPKAVETGSLIFIQRFRIIMMLSLIFMSLAGIIYGLRSKKPLSVLVATVVVASICPLLLIFEYGGETRQRVYLFALLPLISLTLVLLSHKKLRYIILLLILLSPTAHFTARYGNEVLRYISPADILAANFFYSKTSSGNIVSGGNSLALYRSGNYNYEHIHPNWFFSTNGENKYIWINEGFAQALKVNGFAQNNYYYPNNFIEKTTSNLNNTANIVLFYANNYTKYYGYYEKE